MRVMPLLKCIAKAILKGAGNMVGFGLGDVAAAIADHVWDDGERDRLAAERRAEVEAIVQMAAQEFRQQVAKVIKEVAADQPEEVRQQLSNCLEQIPDLARQAFRRPEDPEGRSVPPNWQPKQASDLIPLLSSSSREQSSARAKVVLQFTKGPLAGKEQVYTEPMVLTLGRGKNCNLRFADLEPRLISRHHCLVEINPPDVCVRDLGSMHGTFLGTTLIGQRETVEPDPDFRAKEYDVKDGDEIRLTHKDQAAFVVRVIVPAQCVSCGTKIADNEKSACAQPAGGYQCVECQQQQKPRECAWCHREVASQRGANRPGLFVCEDCRGNFRSIMGGLVSEAKKGNSDLRAIRNFTIDIDQELGHGGMGAVYPARHNTTGQQVAIKLMLPKVAADDRAVELFQREIRNCKALNHRHVVRLLDDGFARGAFFMVMEYCDGRSVDQLMKQRKGKILSVDEAGEIILQALEGLEYAHQADIPFVRQKGGGFGPGKGLVHRDLKPANLFLMGQGSSRITKIGDFGLAKAFDETGLSGGTQTGRVAGTWAFMSRKQAISYKHAGPEVDVWAMAATLYAMLTGRPPREFPEGMDAGLAVLECGMIPILDRNPKIPAKLAKVIDDALKEEPDLQFKSARDLKKALEAVL